jgi:uncharacterized membrane protein
LSIRNHGAALDHRNETIWDAVVAQVALGQVLHQLDELLPANSLPLDDIFAAGLLIFFGLKTLLVRTSLHRLTCNPKQQSARGHAQDM